MTLGLVRLVLKHAIFPLDYGLGDVRPPEYHHCKREEHACREQLPFEVHSDPWDAVWFEECCFSREWMGVSEEISD